MPTLSVFIRKDDISKWKTLENKSEAIHRLLNSEFNKGTDTVVEEGHLTKAVRHIGERHIGTEPVDEPKYESIENL